MGAQVGQPSVRGLKVPDPPSQPSPQLRRALASDGTFRTVSEYYNSLDRDERQKRVESDVETLAVHRWLGKNRSTVEQYRAIYEEIGPHLHHTAAARQFPLLLDVSGQHVGSYPPLLPFVLSSFHPNTTRCAQINF